MAVQSKSLPKTLLAATDGNTEPVETKLASRKIITIGRGSECDLVLKDAKASRQHCRLTRGEAAFVLEDLGSKNGTFVEGQKITEPVSLKSNQSFTVGSTVLYLA